MNLKRNKEADSITFPMPPNFIVITVQSYICQTHTFCRTTEQISMTSESSGGMFFTSPSDVWYCTLM